MAKPPDNDMPDLVEAVGRGRGEYTSPIRDRVSLQRSGPALKVGGPSLDDAALAQGIAVACQALRLMVESLDAQGHDGAGQAQLVLDTAPAQYRALLSGVQVDAHGHLDTARLTHNVRSQPPAQQRRLLQHGLGDVLERCMERSATLVPEAVADQLVGEVLACRRRLLS